MDLVLNSDRPGDEGCTDFTLHPEATSCWITVGNISVYIMRTDEGVAVDLLPKGKEYEEAIGSTWALDSEGLPDEEPWCTRPQIP